MPQARTERPTVRARGARAGSVAFAPLTGFDPANVLVEAIQRLSLVDSLAEIQEIVRIAARELTGADGATLVLREGEQCFYVEENAIAPLWQGQRFPLRSCISGWVMRRREAATIEDIYADDRIPHDVYRPTFVRSLAMVPIRIMDPVGAIGNYWAERHRPTNREVELLQALADSTAVAMENVRIFNQLEDERLDTLRRLALVAEFRDDSTFEHTKRVASTSFQLARQLKTSAREAAMIGQAAPLHDIGKICVPDSILLKPGKLSDGEFELVKRHTTVGSEVLSGGDSEVLDLAAEIAASHHEWWDGSGYPGGLREERIPVCGRIVALADVFDALTHERPYKRAWPVSEAVDEVRRLAGSQFDPRVVAAFDRLDPVELLAPT